MFEGIIGQNKVKKQLESILKSKNIGNAYIFSGPDGVGKKLMAEEFSKYLLEMDIENSQDYNLINPKEGENSIKIEKIRNLIEKMSIKPYGKYKIFVINDAEKLTISAQNSILKTLEEPPSYGIIIMITKNKQSLLETISSRCSEIKFSPLSTENIKEILSKKYFDKETVNLALNFSKCYGSLSMAINICESEDIIQIRDMCEKFLSYNFIEKNKLDVFKTPEYFSEYKDNIGILIDLLKSYIRDSILIKEGADKRIIINSDRIDFILKISEKASLSVLGRNLDIIEETERKLNSNCNFNSTIESMSVRIYDSLN